MDIISVSLAMLLGALICYVLAGKYHKKIYRQIASSIESEYILHDRDISTLYKNLALMMSTYLLAECEDDFLESLESIIDFETEVSNLSVVTVASMFNRLTIKYPYISNFAPRSLHSNHLLPLTANEDWEPEVVLEKFRDLNHYIILNNRLNKLEPGNNTRYLGRIVSKDSVLQLNRYLKRDMSYRLSAE
ncbi:hypothetical protein DRW07_17730 [Alteromonas sediminis]|uniref:Uncharacterized protein n=1 Tax=Alteromonas sediminis TaxID=2259342 RepID=A0A3N5XWD1_9ALTE|nr:hypothetical protein [Alteromonas sediminis]RPJ65147.1 hypothetical protein DRW07_17730 [Alteromonas sediminis]